MLNQSSSTLPGGHFQGLAVCRSTHQLAKVRVAKNVPFYDVAKAAGVTHENGDPVEALMKKQEGDGGAADMSELQEVVEALWDGAAKREKLTFPLCGINDESGRVAKNFVELAALNIQPMRPRESGFRTKKPRHKNSFGNVLF